MLDQERQRWDHLPARQSPCWDHCSAPPEIACGRPQAKGFDLRHLSLSSSSVTDGQTQLREAERRGSGPPAPGPVPSWYRRRIRVCWINTHEAKRVTKCTAIAPLNRGLSYTIASMRSVHLCRNVR